MSDSTPPIVHRNDHGVITSVTCEDSFDATSVYVTEDFSVPLSSPELIDIVVSFDYDAYFVQNSNVDEQLALEEVKNKIFLSVALKSPLLLDEAGTTTDSTCDELMEGQILSMLGMNRRRSQMRGLGDLDTWDHYLGWKNEPDDVDASASVCGSALNITNTYCQPISSYLTAQVPTDTQVDPNFVELQILQHIKQSFENQEFQTDSIPTVAFVGSRQITQEKPEDFINNGSLRDGLIEQATQVMSAFGVSATALLAIATAFASVICGFKVKKSRSKNNIEAEFEELEKQMPQAESSFKFRNIFTQSSNDGVEIVTGDDIQTGFKGVSLSGFMASIKSGDSCCPVDDPCGRSLKNITDEDEKQLLTTSTEDFSSNSKRWFTYK